MLTEHGSNNNQRWKKKIFFFQGKSGWFSVNIICIIYWCTYDWESGRRWWRKKTIVICFYTIDIHSINLDTNMVAEARDDASLELFRITLYTTFFCSLKPALRDKNTCHSNKIQHIFLFVVVIVFLLLWFIWTFWWEKEHMLPNLNTQSVTLSNFPPFEHYIYIS